MSASLTPTPLDPALVQTIRVSVTAAIAEHGIGEASRRLKVGREVLLRLSAGAGVREGTLLLVAQRLGLLTATTTTLSTGPSFTA